MIGPWKGLSLFYTRQSSLARHLSLTSLSRWHVKSFAVWLRVIKSHVKSYFTSLRRSAKLRQRRQSDAKPADCCKELLNCYLKGNYYTNVPPWLELDKWHSCKMSNVCNYHSWLLPYGGLYCAVRSEVPTKDFIQCGSSGCLGIWR